ncbi:twin-arginine translocase subunit TatB [Phenylobacterium montanum]|uniref:Twin-arginine translocase subunit TatB n=2 Tax=Phenylobacterium montanum TaxID=2823693 RepID=A0A975G4V7_9CAUL|nr:twin-arginine translocase subunit TatB [Caulobacter sp. S6]
MGEFMMIAALALIVIGPKDLPVAMRKLGQFIGKLRGMAAEFRASFDELARQSELDELRKEVEALRNSHRSVVSSINPLADSHVSQTMAEINQGLGQVSFAPPMSSQLDAERAAAEAAKAEVPALEAPPAEPAPVMTAKPKAPRKPRAKPAAAKAETKATDAAS